MLVIRPFDACRLLLRGNAERECWPEGGQESFASSLRFDPCEAMEEGSKKNSSWLKSFVHFSFGLEEIFAREEDKVKVVKGGVKIFISERTNFEIEIGGPRFYLRFRSRIFTFEEHFRLKVIHTLDCLEFFFFFGSQIALNTYEILSWIKRKQRNFLTRRIFLEIKLKENGSNAPFWNWERIVSEIDIITNLW